MVSVSSLGYFPYIGYYSKPPPSYLPLSILACHIEEYVNKKRGRKRKFIKPQEDSDRREERGNKMRVTVQVKLVIVFWGFIPMESGYDKSSYQDMATVSK